MKKLLIFTTFLILASCEKESAESGCWDCMIKQSNGIEYPAVYCCTEQEIILIANEQAVNGTKVKCEQR
jgi:hypothetical protein